MAVFSRTVWLLILVGAALVGWSAAAQARRPAAEWTTCRDVANPARTGPLRVGVAQACTVRLRNMPGAQLKRVELRGYMQLRSRDGRFHPERIPGTDMWDRGARPDASRLRVQQSPLEVTFPVYLKPEERWYLSVFVTTVLDFGEDWPKFVRAVIPVSRDQ